jgi:hypothetical protein
MTIVRNPIDRVISHFYYLGFREQDWRSVSQIGTECFDHEERHRTFNQFSNLMSRMLLGTSGGGTTNDGNSPELPSHLWHIFQSETNQCQYTYPYYKSSTNQASTEPIRSNINHLIEDGMDLICLMDDMDGCLERVRKLLRLPSREIKIPHKNSNPKSQKNEAMQNTTIRNQIKSINKVDMMLYDMVVEQYYQESY